MIGMFSSHLFNTCRKLNFLLMLSQASSLSFPDTLQHQVCPELPHCVTFRLFASVFTEALCLRFFLIPYQILFSTGLVCWNISDPVTYIRLFWYELTLCICSDHFGDDLYISIDNQVRHSLWPSLASHVLKRNIYFLLRRPLVSPGFVLCFYHIIKAFPAFLLRHSLQQSLLPCAALTIEPDLQSIETHKFFLMELLMPLSCISSILFTDYEVTNFSLYWPGLFFQSYLSGNFPACPLGILHTGYP